MTPKEKAEELVEKFRPQCYCFLGSGMLTNTYNEEVSTMNAKQCALIAVDEILKDELGIMPAKWMSDYWQEVKQELEKL